MSFYPLSINQQYYIGFNDYFPNKKRRYVRLCIENKKARHDQKATRKVEAISLNQQKYNAMLNSRNPEKRKRAQTMIDNILRHHFDQSIIANEHGHFASLPRASVIESSFPEKGYIRKTSGAYSPAQIKSELSNSFVTTNFQRLTDGQLTTPPLLVVGREQPLGGTESTPETLQVPKFVPNASYGGTQVRYR